MRVCLEPGCARLSDSTRCEYHRKAKAKAADKRRPNANQRGYGAHWRKVRKQFLRDNPNCIDCGGKATVPDHAPLSRVQIVAQGVADPDAPAFLQPRCHTCHMRRTVLEDGGFGRERKEYR